MTERDGSKARASAICIRRGHLLWMVAGAARKNGWRVLISAAKPGDFKVLLALKVAEQEVAGRGEVMSDIVTAGILVIGDEILSGRTKDKNIGFIAEYLTNIGIDLKEVRVVADEEAEIIAALDALRHRYTYVFTTGGIGPTHDDITADSVAKAFGVGIDHHPEVVARFRERFQGAGETQRGAAAHGADSRRRRTDPERDHPGARLQDRQCHRHGRRALDHAGDDGHRRAEAEIGGADAVGIGPRQCAGRRHRRSLARRSPTPIPTP